MVNCFTKHIFMKLRGKRVAILATDGFEQSELFKPMEALKAEGAEVDVISDKSGEIRGWSGTDWGQAVMVNKEIKDAKVRDYNGLVLPGGVINPDNLRINNEAIEFTREFFEQGKPVGAICHAPQILISADVVKNRTMTSYKSIKKDLENAGANWIDAEVVVDQGLVTSRNPKDIPAFNAKLIEEIKEGVHEGQLVDA